jgi:hypothetical protein
LFEMVVVLWGEDVIDGDVRLDYVHDG